MTLFALLELKSRLTNICQFSNVKKMPDRAWLCNLSKQPASFIHHQYSDSPGFKEVCERCSKSKWKKIVMKRDLKLRWHLSSNCYSNLQRGSQVFFQQNDLNRRKARSFWLFSRAFWFKAFSFWKNQKDLAKNIGKRGK